MKQPGKGKGNRSGQSGTGSGKKELEYITRQHEKRCY